MSLNKTSLPSCLIAFVSTSFILLFIPVSKSLAQNVGIGIPTPLARLHVVDSSVVFSGSGFVSLPAGNPPITGTGRRMMWYANKAAFRTGYVSLANWDNDSVGPYSFAAGFDTKAKGLTSVAMGNATTASANYSTAMGIGSVASGEVSTAMGFYSTARGAYSSAFGAGMLAKAPGSFIIGTYNDTADTPDPFNFSPSDRLFQIGNGIVTRSNAMTVLRNGNVGIGTTFPAANLHMVTTYSNPFIVDGGPSLFMSWAENGNYRGYLGSFAGNPEDIDFGTYFGNTTGKIHFTIEDIPKVTIVPSGNTGIGTTTPSEKLEVTGNIKADSIKASAFTYSSPKMLYYSIPDAAFSSTNSGYLVFKTGGSGGAYIANAPGVGQLVAPLHLPHGAVLVSMTFDFYDVSATQDITGQLILQSNGFITPYSGVQSSGSTGANSQTVNYNVPINNQSLAYYVSVSASTGAWNNNDIRIRRILIQYTLNEAQ